MNSLQKQLTLIQKLSLTTNQELIDAVGRLFQLEEEGETIKFSQKEESQVKKGIKQYQTGEYITSKVADEEIRKWTEE
ncbi:MAG: hypothetical protein COA58_11105 [Bacteroidetes bacterium]|nr:MAG: hypothetical protein COA58_11105 [Bacteroidota bacterium]